MKNHGLPHFFCCFYFRVAKKIAFIFVHKNFRREGWYPQPSYSRGSVITPQPWLLGELDSLCLLAPEVATYGHTTPGHTR